MEILKLETWINEFGQERINLDQLKEYLDFIIEARDRYDSNRYSEWHHIIPRCLDPGKKFRDQGVQINGADHFRAHMRLVKCFLYRDYKIKLSCALAYMHRSAAIEGLITPEEFEETRRLLVENHKNRGETHPMYGKHFSKESRMKMSLSARGRVVSESTRRKISEVTKGRKISDQHRNSIVKHQTGESNSFYGKHHTEETKAIIGEKSKGNKSTKGHIWITDGSVSKMILATEQIPEGWIRGMTRNKKRGFD